jgi:ADP-ribose pyrophosphatase
MIPSDDDIQEKQVYQCRIFSVYEGKILFPNGRVTHQSRIDHRPCVAVVPIDKEGRVILIKQYRYSVRKQLIEIPAGNMDKGNESPEVCARRELSEETGYGANLWALLYEGYLLPGYCNEYMYFYLAADLYHAPLEPDDDEYIEILPVPMEEAMEMIKTGRIVDAKTALGLYMARDYLKGNIHGN